MKNSKDVLRAEQSQILSYVESQLTDLPEEMNGIIRKINLLLGRFKQLEELRSAIEILDHSGKSENTIN